MSVYIRVIAVLAIVRDNHITTVRKLCDAQLCTEVAREFDIISDFRAISLIDSKHTGILVVLSTQDPELTLNDKEVSLADKPRRNLELAVNLDALLSIYLPLKRTIAPRPCDQEVSVLDRNDAGFGLEIIRERINLEFISNALEIRV